MQSLLAGMLIKDKSVTAGRGVYISLCKRPISNPFWSLLIQTVYLCIDEWVMVGNMSRFAFRLKSCQDPASRFHVRDCIMHQFFKPIRAEAGSRNQNTFDYRDVSHWNLEKSFFWTRLPPYCYLFATLTFEGNVFVLTWYALLNYFPGSILFVHIYIYIYIVITLYSKKRTVFKRIYN